MVSVLPEVLARTRVKQLSSSWASGLVLVGEEGRDEGRVVGNGDREEEGSDIDRQVDRDGARE